MPATAARRRRGLAVTIGLVLCLALLAAGALWLKSQIVVAPLPMAEKCEIVDGDYTTSLTPSQAGFAATIVGTATKRGLAPRAGIIGIATALQESGLRNLDYGDRDSLGLFQQRPSQGWGTEEQLMDPYYSSNKFYEALENVDDWETGDINDVAQEVQRSGVPDGYRKHVQRATAIGNVLSGTSGTIRCLDRGNLPGDAAGYVSLLEKTYGFTNGTLAGQRVSFDTRTPDGARALAYLAVANTHALGVTTVTVGDQRVVTSTASPQPWTAATPAYGATHVVVEFRGA